VTLSGVIKDILLVVLSMLIFGNPVTPLQFFGYSVALLGLVAYKSGGFPSKKSEYEELIRQYLNRNRIIFMLLISIVVAAQYLLQFAELDEATMDDLALSSGSDTYKS